MKKHALLFIPGFILILFSAICWYFNLYINLTPSMPIGIWHASSTRSGLPFELPRGSFISFCLENQPELFSRDYFLKGTCPNGFAPLLKPIVAHQDDIVDITLNVVTINGIHLKHSGTLTKDSEGRPLPLISRGRYVLRKDDYWVLATDHSNSLDSRYFGVIHKTAILNLMEPVWVYSPQALP